MSLLTVERNIFNADNTLSKCFLLGTLFCFGIEDEKREVKKKAETCIPDGIYRLGLRQSPKFSSNYYTRDGINLITRKEYLNLPSAVKPSYKPHEMIWVQGVPNFQYILIHWGNTDDDTDGCYIVGSRIGILGGQEAVLNSRLTYVKLYREVAGKIRKGDQFITYKSV